MTDGCDSSKRTGRARLEVGPRLRRATSDLHVLLVEDNPGDVRLVRELLDDVGATGVRISCATSLEAAIARIAEVAFDAALVDLGLPDSQGLDTVRRLNSTNPYLPIVVLTGWTDPDLALEAVRTGAQDCLSKQSITGEALVRVMRYAVERQRHEHWQTFLAEVGRVLASSIDYTTTLQCVADLAVPMLADVCLVDVLESDGGLQRFGVAGRGLADEQWAGQLRGSFELPTEALYGVPHVLRTGEVELLSHVNGRPLRQLFPLVPCGGTSDPLDVLRRIQPRSRIVAPLVVRDRVIGSLTLVRTSQSNACYTAADLPLAEQLAQRAALAIDNARLFRDAEAAVRARDQALQVRQDVLRFVSHDLKNPLTNVRLHTEMLLESLRESAVDAQDTGLDHVVRGLRRIDDVTLSMWGLVNELLDVSQLQSGSSLRLERAPVDLVALVRDSLADFAARASRQLTLQSIESTLVGSWDRARLRRVIDNLISNAIKYSPDGGAIRVSLERLSAPDRARLQVQDCGIGIPAQDLPHIFEGFYRASNVPADLRGTGVGLAGARQIVQQHGGEVTVASVEGQGTTVTLELPLD